METELLKAGFIILAGVGLIIFNFSATKALNAISKIWKTK